MLTKYSKFILLFILIAVPIFGNLNVQPIRIWDEARLVINAYQMNQDNDWIVTHYKDNHPDMWNTKPPLLIWCQVLLIKLLGLGEIAIRLPSGIAAFLTCLALLILSIRYLKDFIFGFIVCMVLITSYGYIHMHATRTGDYDALLTFFTTISAISFFAYMENQSPRYLYLFFLFLALGVLTKGVSALLFSPAFVIYCIWQKQFISLLKNKHLYLGVFIFLFIAIGYYLLREHYNPGYIKAVSENELGGRYLKTLANLKGGFWFYYTFLINEHFSAWYLLVPCGLLVGIFSEDSKKQKLTVFSTLLILVYFLVISTAQTKLYWYDCPIFPFASIIVTLFIHFIFIYIERCAFKNIPLTLKFNIIPYLFLFIVLIGPYQQIINKTYYSKEYPWDEDFYRLSCYIRNGITNPKKVNNCFILRDDSKDQLFLYLKILEKKGVRVGIKTRNELKTGDTVIVNEQEVRDYIATNYEFNTLENYYNISKYKLTGPKI